MGLQQFLMLVLRGWWVIALATLVTAGSTAFFVSRQDPEYRATTTVEIVPHGLLDSREAVDVYNLLDKRSLSNTLARKAEGSSMAQLVATKLGVSPDVIGQADISAIVLPDSNIIEIRASSSDSELAAAIANTITDEMLGQNRTKILQIEAIDRAIPPSSPIAPQPTRMLILGLFSGIVLGVLLILTEHLIRGGQSGPGGGAWIGGDRHEQAPRLTPPVVASSALNASEK
jgi:polysaccharide biosynthesis transport protein